MKKKQYIAPEISICQTYGDAVLYGASIEQADEDWTDAKMYNSFNVMDEDYESGAYNSLWDSRWDSQQNDDNSYGVW